MRGMLFSNAACFGTLAAKLKVETQAQASIYHVSNSAIAAGIPWRQIECPLRDPRTIFQAKVKR